jgi:large exoprotein involved in heme utilization and adhesion
MLTVARSGGQGGKLTINASDSIQLSGASPLANLTVRRSGIFVSAEPGAIRDAGELNITTGQLTVKNGAEISANNFGSGKGGTATLNVRKLMIRDGGEVRARAFDRGSGGNLIVNAAESVDVVGTGTIGSETFPSALSTSASASGRAGNLTITTDQLNVSDGAEVTVSSQGSGQAGDLEVMAGSVKLDRGKLIGQTASADGGNITLNLRELLLLRRNSQISTSAGLAGAGGDGGDININTKFLIAVPEENSDITANAFEGSGGFIRIAAQGVFGIERRKHLTPLSDITAFSQQNPELNGVVEINTPEVEPNRGLVELPTQPVNVEVAQGCQVGSKQASLEFFNTGRGGIAPNPYEPLSSSNLWEDVPPSTNASIATPPDQIVEAQGWLLDEKGEVILVAEMPTIQSQSRCRLR